MEKNALIVTNTIGMFHFLWTDIDMLNEMGYKVYAIRQSCGRGAYSPHDGRQECYVC